MAKTISHAPLIRGMVLASSLVLAPFTVPSARGHEFKDAAQETTAPASAADKTVAALTAGLTKTLEEDKGLAKLIADDGMACAATVNGSFMPLMVAADDPRILRLQETYGLARAIPHFREAGNAAEKGGMGLIDCQSGKVSDNLLGNYWYYRDFATYYRRDNAHLEAMAKFHEREHRMRNQHFSYRKMNEKLRYGEDLAYNGLIDEVNAYTRDLTAAYVMKLRGTPEYWDSLARHVLKSDVIQAAGLYDQDALKDYAATTGFLPPLLMRHAFVAVTQNFVNEDYYYTSQKNHLARKPKGSGIDDVFVIRSTSYDGYNYLHRTAGILDYMKAHSPIDHRMRGATFDETVAAIHKARIEGADYTRIIRRMHELSKPAYTSHDSDAGAYLVEAVTHAKKAGELDFPFVVNDLIAFTRHYSDAIERGRADFTPQRLATRRQSVHDVMGVLQAERKRLCRNAPTARAAANLACG